VRVFSLTNPMVYWAPPEFGLKLSRAFHDACAAAHRKHSDRFLGTIMLPMQSPELAVQELQREREMILCENAVRVLKLKERFRQFTRRCAIEGVKGEE
jgi:hypothetical protein